MVTLDLESVKEELLAEGIVTGGVPMPPKRYGSCKMTLDSAPKFASNPAFFRVPTTEGATNDGNGRAANGSAVADASEQPAKEVSVRSFGPEMFL